jgi:hypothetical protein
MIVNYNDIRIDLKHIEAISEIKFHEIDGRFMWFGEIYKYWEYRLYSKSGIVYSRCCEYENELENFKMFYENILDTWEAVNAK